MRPRRESRNNQYAYFVSTQTIGRKPFFRHDRWARLMVATLTHYAETDFILHAYVVMPDHLHLLITPSVSVEKSVQLIKGGFFFRARRDLEWKFDIWQQGFTDHRIREEEDWANHLGYIRMNPVRARLLEDPVLYPHVGFPNPHFPRGLKPLRVADPDVRAEARTLQPEAHTPQAEAEPLSSPAAQEYPDAAKGTGFSPSVEASRAVGALAPEGGKR